MITKDQIRKLSPRDGDVFVLPRNTSHETAKVFAEAVHEVAPDIRVTVITGELAQMGESAMNAAGWFRK